MTSGLELFTPKNINLAHIMTNGLFVPVFVFVHVLNLKKSTCTLRGGL